MKHSVRHGLASPRCVDREWTFGKATLHAARLKILCAILGEMGSSLMLEIRQPITWTSSGPLMISRSMWLMLPTQSHGIRPLGRDFPRRGRRLRDDWTLYVTCVRFCSIQRECIGR